MKNNAVRWLYAVPGRKKLYILALMLVQALYGASGVLYALLLRNLREMTDKTVIIVTHRPAALDICDRVLEFTENGVMEKNGKA